MNEVMRDPKSGKPFWSQECEDPIKAIGFALEHVDGDNDAIVFLRGWYEGDVSEFPEFFQHVGVAV